MALNAGQACFRKLSGILFLGRRSVHFNIGKRSVLVVSRAWVIFRALRITHAHKILQLGGGGCGSVQDDQ